MKKETDSLQALCSDIYIPRILRALVRNSTIYKEPKEFSKGLRIQLTKVKTILRRFEKYDIVIAKSYIIKEETKTSVRKKKVIGYIINTKHPHYNEIRALALATSLDVDEAFVKHIKKAGKLTHLILTGHFVGNTLAETDVLVVGNTINEGVVKQALEILEGAYAIDARYVICTPHENHTGITHRNSFFTHIYDLPHRSLIS